MLEAYGGECKCCGEDIPEFLVLDHVNGDGGIERRRIGRSSSASYLSAKRQGFPDKYRLLCFCCNNAIAKTGVCPHEIN